MRGSGRRDNDAEARGASSHPTYAQLPLLEGTDDRHAWDVWGRGDSVGSVNRLDAARVRSAANLVREGEVINLSLPLDQPNPGVFSSRTPYRHHVLTARNSRDERIDGFYTQFSSQWDGLGHVRYGKHGYWGGRDEAEVDRGELGIDHWARHGIVGRGVLIDVEAYLGDKDGSDYRPDTRFPIDGDLIEEVARHQGVALHPGDVVLLRTGWLEWYTALTQSEKITLAGAIGPGGVDLACAGLDPSRLTAAWVWDHGIAALAADNPALEVLPVDRLVGFQHRRLIALLGIAIGESWDLRRLGEACRRDGIYEFMLVGAPLFLPGGVGSPANAYAIK